MSDSHTTQKPIKQYGATAFFPLAEQREFFRIREKATGEFFTGGRGLAHFDGKGIRYEKMQPVTAALNYFAEQRARAVEMLGKYVAAATVEIDVELRQAYQDRADYWQLVRDRFKPENFEVIKYREVIEAIETVVIK